MTQINDFDYAATGLPDNTRYHSAANLCHRWLLAHMGNMFNPKQILSFMNNQPITAAKNLLEKTENPSEESLIVALLGPAKGDIIAIGGTEHSPQRQAVEKEMRGIFGDRCIDLIHTLAGKPATDQRMLRDAKRIFLVEGLSTMNDQLIGRKRIDPHHQVR